MREVGEALALLTELREAYAAGQHLYWALTVPPAQGVIGICGFNSWQRSHRRAAIGYDLARSYWGQGIGTEAVGAIVRFGFERMGLNRVEAETIIDNWASVRLLEKLGFRREGVRREYSWEDDGRFHGSTVNGLLRSEYLRRGAAGRGAAAGAPGRGA